jgi:hypothetical protein
VLVVLASVGFFTGRGVGWLRWVWLVVLAAISSAATTDKNPTPLSLPVKMVKQKNHTARNNTVKAHKNGIKKPKNHRYHSTKGVRAIRSSNGLLEREILTN